MTTKRHNYITDLAKRPISAAERRGSGRCACIPVSVPVPPPARLSALEAMRTGAAGGPQLPRERFKPPPPGGCRCSHRLSWLLNAHTCASPASPGSRLGTFPLSRPPRAGKRGCSQSTHWELQEPPLRDGQQLGRAAVSPTARRQPSSASRAPRQRGLLHAACISSLLFLSLLFPSFPAWGVPREWKSGLSPTTARPGSCCSAPGEPRGSLAGDAPRSTASRLC